MAGPGAPGGRPCQQFVSHDFCIDAKQLFLKRPKNAK